MRLLQLNVVSTVHLSKRLLPAMVERGVGRMLFTAAVASTMPGPFYATSAATKSFMLSFAEALRYEVKDSSVTVTALMPGPTDNSFPGKMGQASPQPMVMTTSEAWTDSVVRIFGVWVEMSIPSSAMAWMATGLTWLLGVDPAERTSILPSARNVR